MEEVVKWLNANDLGELSEVFEREKINSMVRVRRLNGDLIKDIIPQVGPRADFLACLAELKSVQRETNQTADGSLEIFQTKATTIIANDPFFANQEESSVHTQPIFIDEDGSVISVLTVENVVDNIDQDSGIGPHTENDDSNALLPSTSSYTSLASSIISSDDKNTGSNSEGKRKHSCSNSDRLQSKHLSASQGLKKLKSLDVEQLLDNDLTSEAAVIYYRKNGCFTEPGRQAMVLVLVRELMKSNQSPSHAEYQLITNKLCQLFPEEDPEIYYCPPIGARKNATGEIPNKVRNIKYALTKHNAAPISKPNKSNIAAESTSAGRRNDKLVKPAKLSGSTDKNDRTIQSAISVLRHHSTDSWPELIKSWSATHALRFKYLRSTRLQQSDQSALQERETDEDDDTLVNEYFKEWSILVAPNGYLLICQDFSELYPGKENSLLAKWDNCKKLIIDLAIKESSKLDSETQILLDSLTDIPEGAQDVTILHLLVTLCCKRGRGNGSSKVPSILEARKSFMLHVEIPGDLARGIRNYRQNLKARGLRLQPLIVFVGPSITDITASYVQIDNIRYKLRTPLAAVDTCFKAFYALDAAYPVESQAVWLLIQRFFYEIYLNEDPNICRVLAVQSSLNALRTKEG